MQNQLYLAGVGLGEAICQIFTYGIIQCFTVGAGVEFYSAFSWNKAFLVDIYYQRCLFMCIFFCILMTPFLYLVDWFLFISGIQYDIAYTAGKYVWVALPSFYCYGFICSTKVYLESQKITIPLIIMQGIQVVFHFFMATYLMETENEAHINAAWAQVLSDILLALLLYFYCKFYEWQKAGQFIEWNFMAFERISYFTQNALMNGAPAYMEEFLINANCIVAAHLPVTQLAAHIITTNSAGFHYTLFFSFAFIVFTTITEALKQQETNRAKNKAIISFLGFVGVGVLVKILLSSQTSLWINIYTNNPDVMIYLEKIVSCYATLILLDAMVLNLLSIYKSLGFQQEGTIIYLITIYLLGIPLCFYYAFSQDQGVYGFWLAMLYAKIFAIVLYSHFILRADWLQQARIIKTKFLKDDQAMDQELKQAIK